jgi:hypothetical protein
MGARVAPGPLSSGSGYDGVRVPLVNVQLSTANGNYTAHEALHCGRACGIIFCFNCCTSVLHTYLKERREETHCSF